jgi:hypothetical protein
MPKQTFAFSAGFNWKGFYADVMFQGVAGNKIAYVGKSRILSDVEGNFSRAKEIFNAWSPENQHTYLPRLAKNDPNGNFSQPSDFYIEDGSYVRLKNVSLGYNFPKKMVTRWGLESLRLYCNFQNLLTITGYDGYDPEIGASTQSANVMGLDNARYPSPTTYSFGLNVSF